MRMKRNEHIRFRLSKEERQCLVVLAVQEGLTISETFRLLLREGIRRRGIESPGFGHILEAILLESKVEDKAR